MSVRDPGFDPRQQHPRSGAHPVTSRPVRGRGSGSGGRSPGPGGPQGSGPSRPGAPGGWFLPALAAVALLLVVALGFGSGMLGASGRTSARQESPAAATDGTPPLTGEAGSAGPSDPAASPSDPATSPSDPAASDAPAPGASDVAPAPPADDPAPSSDAGASAAPVAEADVAIVPVTAFRSARTAATKAQVKGMAGGDTTWSALVLIAQDRDPVLGALGVDVAALGDRLVLVRDPAAMQAYLSKHPRALGFLRADQVDPSVRALAWGSTSLFGNDRVGKLAAWPLVARLATSGGHHYDPAKAYTIVAGGDILLDRGVSLAINKAPARQDFPFNGGSVAITGHCKDCSPMGWDLPYTKRTSSAQLVRDLISGADLALANFENPAPDNWRFHGKGMIFSANPKHIAGLADAGIDWVSMANNHMGDAGKQGVLDTAKNLSRYGIAHSGAGKNDPAAHKAALLEAGGVTVGILGYDSIAGYYKAGPTTPGTARLSTAALKRDIAAARKAGADVVIVYPHWGVEYHEKPSQYQVDMGRAAIDAGADMVIGNHPHWVEGMEIYKGKPIWYALGNFVFDQTWSEYTMEGITLELTMQGTRLEQIRIRPHLIMGKAQPNVMDPATGGGKFVMDQFWRSSKGHLGW